MATRISVATQQRDTRGLETRPPRASLRIIPLGNAIVRQKVSVFALRTGGQRQSDGALKWKTPSERMIDDKTHKRWHPEELLISAVYFRLG